MDSIEAGRAAEGCSVTARERILLADGDAHQEAVESEKPPTVTALAARGKKKRSSMAESAAASIPAIPGEHLWRRP